MTRAMTREEKKELLEKLTRLDEAIHSSINMAELGVLVVDDNLKGYPSAVTIIGDFLVVDLKPR